MKTRWLLLLGCLLAVSVQAQESKKELWKWTDSNGVVHFSDVPGPGAVRVDLTVTEAAPSATPQRAPASSANQDAASGVSYNSLEIWQPAMGASFFGADTTVDVRIRVDPSVSSDDRLLLFLDGKRVDGGPNSLEYSLTNLDRGAHSITAQIIDMNGKEKIRSQPVVFHIQQASVNKSPNVGPLLRPQPKPGGG